MVFKDYFGRRGSVEVFVCSLGFILYMKLSKILMIEENNRWSDCSSMYLPSTPKCEVGIHVKKFLYAPLLA